MDVQKITNKKLKGDSLTHNELESVIKSYVDNAIDDSIMGKFLKSIHLKGMEIDEIVSLTQIMIDSGEIIDFSNLESYVADKHSTGGVGDKVSIILGPILAALGISVPMLAGRSLGHTGGTIDKLETIPGFKTDLSITDFKKNVERSGLCIMSQTNTICPADKKIYSLRSKTGTVASIPLICGSIMSKKIAVITGAAGGIGREIVASLIQDGAKCYGLDISKEGLKELESTLGNEYVGIEVDLTKLEKIRSSYKQIGSIEGGMDILVNNAGITKDNLLLRMSEDDFNQVLNVNLNSVFNLSLIHISEPTRPY